MNILTLDSSQIDGTLALFIHNKKVAEKKYSRERRFSIHLVHDIENIIKNNKFTLKDIDYFAIIIGPGSFTGLRIGLTTIKALAWTLNKPIIPISTLRALAHNVHKDNTLICPLIDAKQNTIYGAGYFFKNKKYEEKIPDNKYTISQFKDLLIKIDPKDVVFLGNGAAVYRTQLGDVSIEDFQTITSSNIFHIAKSIITEEPKKIITEFMNLEPNYCNEEYVSFTSFPKSKMQ